MNDKTALLNEEQLDEEQSELIKRATAIIADARAFVFAAGAGMGVDSGLPDFRGDEGFWRAYPPFRKLGLGFQELANPRWFDNEPELAWGFYGHRMNLYRRTVPHEGYSILRAWAERAESFVYTSNVDGAFQRASFDDSWVYECHGSLHYVHCSAVCGWFEKADDIALDVDEETMRAKEPLPRCKNCGKIARPALLMFGDDRWDDRRSSAQESEFEEFLREQTGEAEGAKGLVVIECGAGTAIPSVRLMSESLVRAGGTLIRINVRESQVPRGSIGLAIGAKAALTAIDALLEKNLVAPKRRLGRLRLGRPRSKREANSLRCSISSCSK